MNNQKLIQVGDTIEIKPTDNVLSRFPDLVGNFANVISSPIHPSTWFTVKIIGGEEQIIKLQPTAMQVITSNNTVPEPVVEKIERLTPVPEVSKASASVDDTMVFDGSRQRAQSLGHIIHCSQVPALKLGVGVTILRTENVVQRAPHLVGLQGIIKEVPGMI